MALLYDALTQQGVDMGPALAAAGLSARDIHAPRTAFTLSQFDTLVRETARSSGRADIGFLLGREVKLSSHVTLGYGILTSPTLDYAVTLTSRFYRLINPWMQMHYRRGRHQCELHFQPQMELPPASLAFLLEAAVVSTHYQLKSQLGRRLTPYEVHTSYARPAHAGHYAELRPARVHFGTEPLPSVRIVLDTELMAEPLPMADRHTLKLAEERCEELLRKTAEVTGLTQWVTMMMREAADGVPSREQLARLLNQSPASLDRKLKREGCRFLELSKRIRHERACALLDQGRSATEVAHEVGYRDLANFTRAFRRESGKTPSDYARQLRP